MGSISNYHTTVGAQYAQQPCTASIRGALFFFIPLLLGRDEGPEGVENICFIFRLFFRICHLPSLRRQKLDRIELNWIYIFLIDFRFPELDYHILVSAAAVIVVQQ